MNFKEQILQGIPSTLPPKKDLKPGVNRAPKRKDILSNEEKKAFFFKNAESIYKI